MFTGNELGAENWAASGLLIETCKPLGAIRAASALLTVLLSGQTLPPNHRCRLRP
jgi:hypothetical protein